MLTKEANARDNKAVRSAKRDEEMPEKRTYSDPLTQRRKPVGFRGLSQHERFLATGIEPTIQEEDLDHQGTVGKQELQLIVEELGKQNAGRPRTSWRLRRSNLSTKKRSFTGSSPDQIQGLGTSNLSNLIVKTVSHTSTSTNAASKISLVGLQDESNTSCHGQITVIPLGTSLELQQDRIQRLFEDDLHQKRLELKREKSRSHQNHSHVLQSVNAGGPRRMAEDLESRIKRLNDRITTLLKKRPGSVSA